jgi:hypothetical protein
MIPFAADIYDRRAEANVTIDAIVVPASINEQDIELTDPGLTMVADVLKPGASQVSQNQRELPEPMAWTRELEAKFQRLAQRHALGELSLGGKVEFETLSARRRHLKNPRTGEEVIAEYEQRAITRELVQALAKYVNWHRRYATNNPR